ncbi:Transposon Ty3-G Gag-Pol poly [Paramuricea clavata]|uniref:Transposon Ty3-G Gag-Pol poly n=1 Tax=Paramuricea clavata TaxID=317549 RepID=A0A6S7IND5_PARCT|nr:Transposon Ty3-G Gag-Pol poly [Paramuricea clavata]
MVAMETKKDPVLSKVLDFTKNGWPEKPQTELQLYHTRRLELSHEDGILLWDTRVAIPESLRDILLKDLHAEHFGIVKMKQLARKYLWWPKLNKEIEETVKSCMACQEEAKSPNASQQASWSWPGGPWKRIHIDYAGPYLGKMFLVVVDAYSKYLDIVPMSNATSTTTITALRHIFSNFGLPEHIVSDNGSQFTSEEFQKFLNDNNIQHTTTAPGHPATNGLAERYVGNFKDKLKKMGDTGKPLQTKLDRFLLTYRATPTGLGKSPSELLMNRQPRIRLSALRAKQSKNEVKIFQDNLDNQPNFENAEQAKSEMEQNLFPEPKTETNKRETIPAHTEDRVPAVPSGVKNEFDTFTPVNTKSKDRDCGELTSKMDSLINVTPSESTRRYPLRERKPPKRFTE